MSGFDEEDGFTGDAAVKTVESHTMAPKMRMARTVRALSMFDAQRATLYSTMAGLIDGGLSIKTAATLLSDEFSREGQKDAAVSVEIFFKTIVRAREAKIPATTEVFKQIEEAAFEAFGNRFVGPEEMSLLKALAVAPLPSRILESCSALLARHEAGRTNSIISSARRFGG